MEIKDIYSGCDHPVAIHLTCQLCALEAKDKQIAELECHLSISRGNHKLSIERIAELEAALRDICNDCTCDSVITARAALKGECDGS